MNTGSLPLKKLKLLSEKPGHLSGQINAQGWMNLCNGTFSELFIWG